MTTDTMRMITEKNAVIFSAVSPARVINYHRLICYRKYIFECKIAMRDVD